MKPTNQKQDPKLKQFLDELNELQETYQYSLKAVLNVTPGGITPSFSVVNVVPPKKAKPVSKKKGKK